MNEQREVIRAQLSCGVDYYKGEKGDKPVKGVDYFTQEDIDSIIEQIEAGDIDLTSYATKEYVNDKIDDIVETDPTVPEWAKQANKPTYTAAEVGALPANTVIPTVPTNVSAFTNDAGYLTSHQSLDNYATKSYVEQVVAGIETGALKRSIVSSLPSTGIDENTIYMVANSGSGNDVYDEYLYVNNRWEKIGSSAVDLTDYATKNYVDNAVSSIEISDVIAGYAATSPTSDPEPYYLDFVLDDMDMTIRGKQDRLVFNTAYNENTNKVATMADIPTVDWSEIPVDNTSIVLLDEGEGPHLTVADVPIASVMLGDPSPSAEPGDMIDLQTYLDDYISPSIANKQDAIIPTAPSTDGTYFLTTTITSGTPTYSWENVVIGGSY